MTQTPGFVTHRNPIEVDDTVRVSEETLRWYESELRKEPSHYTRKINHGPVTARIHRKLRNARAAISKMTAVDPNAGERFIKYVKDVIGPLLVDKGTPFSELDDIIAELRGKYSTVTV